MSKGMHSRLIVLLRRLALRAGEGWHMSPWPKTLLIVAIGASGFVVWYTLPTAPPSQAVEVTFAAAWTALTTLAGHHPILTLYGLGMLVVFGGFAVMLLAAVAFAFGGRSR